MTIYTPIEPHQSFDGRLNQLQQRALIAAAAGLLLAALGAYLNSAQFFQSYLFAYLFWLGITLGGLVWTLLHSITGGRWGAAIRPLIEASGLLVWLMALLFIPLYFGLGQLYLWARPEMVQQDALLQHKSAYLNIPFFTGRAALYFLIWAISATLLYRWSRSVNVNQSDWRSLPLANRMRRFSGPALALYGLAVTFAAVDWVMSLEPHWFSTIFGVLLAAGQVVAGLAFAIAMLAFLARTAPVTALVTVDHLQDLGKLLLAVVIFWAYIAFSQYLIIWSGNIPEETVWYFHRLRGGWRWVALLLLIFHFALPFALLLSGRIKRSLSALATIAAILLASQLLHLFWVVAPAFSGSEFHIHWLDLVLPIGLGAIWLVAFVWWLRRRSWHAPVTEAP